MPHIYRKLQHWDQWLDHHRLGHFLLKQEAETICTLTKQHYGKHVVTIGVPTQSTLTQTLPLPCHTLLTPIFNPSSGDWLVEADQYELPILSGSVDLVIIPHTLELIENPRQCLSEACRIIKPEGLIIVIGFNPFSFWGIYQLLSQKKKQVPWSNQRIHAQQVRNWLQLADFQVEATCSALWVPPIKSSRHGQPFDFIERMGQICLPKLGSLYFVMARAKVTPLTPIKLKWKQQLSGLRLPNSITGHIARQQK